MSLIETPDSLFRVVAPVIAHGVNCRGAFGSGVALQIARRYPEVRQAYLDKFHASGWSLGEVQLVMAADGRLVGNVATQDRYGRREAGDPPFASLHHIEMGLAELLRQCGAFGVDRVAIPRIGCGLGGLDWAEVQPVLARVAHATRVDLIVCGCR